MTAFRMKLEFFLDIRLLMLLDLSDIREKTVNTAAYGKYTAMNAKQNNYLRVSSIAAMFTSRYFKLAEVSRR